MVLGQAQSIWQNIWRLFWAVVLFQSAVGESESWYYVLYSHEVCLNDWNSGSVTTVLEIREGWETIIDPSRGGERGHHSHIPGISDVLYHLGLHSMFIGSTETWQFYHCDVLKWHQKKNTPILRLWLESLHSQELGSHKSKVLLNLHKSEQYLERKC